MDELTLHVPIIEYFNSFEQLGVPLQLCMFKYGNYSDQYLISQKAARLAMDHFSHAGNVLKGKEPAVHRINFQEFIGKAYNIEKEELSIYTYSEGGGMSMTLNDQGLAVALLTPPYGLDLNLRNRPSSPGYGKEHAMTLKMLFLKFCDQILDLQDLSKGEEFIIYRWSQDWSSYFDKYFIWQNPYWTIMDEEKQLIYVLG